MTVDQLIANLLDARMKGANALALIELFAIGNREMGVPGTRVSQGGLVLHPSYGTHTVTWALGEESKGTHMGREVLQSPDEHASDAEGSE